jgi:hypothetical protein
VIQAPRPPGLDPGGEPGGSSFGRRSCCQFWGIETASASPAAVLNSTTQVAAPKAKGAQRRPRPPRPLVPFPRVPKRGWSIAKSVCVLWPPWGVPDRIEPGPAGAQLMVKASWTAPQIPPIPPELSTNYARTQWN